MQLWGARVIVWDSLRPPHNCFLWKRLQQKQTLFVRKGCIMIVLPWLVFITNTLNASDAALSATVRTAMSCGTVPCSCIGRPTVVEARERARDVVLGEPIAHRDTTVEVARNGDRVWTTSAVIVTLRVHARWKGAARDTLDVLTLREASMCGVHLALEERYLLFSEGTSQLPWVTSCSRTARERESSAMLRALGSPPSGG